jgi:hypothetical protein
MATISNTPRPGYVWDATDNVWYPIGVGGHGHPDYITQATAVNPTIIDAKGDIITATAADTPARLAVGNNGETLVADSSTSTGLRYTAGTVQANPILNSAMQVWQRGTSITVASSGGTYTADRWQSYRGATGSTVSRQVTGDTTNLPNIQYAARVQRDSGNTGTSPIYFGQSFESVNSIPYAGKTVTFSFYARAGANYSAASSALGVSLISGTGTDQNLITAGYTGSTNVIVTSATLTTTWQRFNYTASISASATEIGFYFTHTPVGTAGAADYAEVTGVQIDIGSVALPYRTYAATLQGELAACQRYYEKSYDLAITAGTSSAAGMNYTYGSSDGSSFTRTTVRYAVQKRITSPTLTFYTQTGTATNWTYYKNGANANAVLTADSQGTGGFSAYINVGGTWIVCYIFGHWVADAEL